MKRSLFPRLALMAMTIAFFSACSEKQEYTNVIPADVKMVVSVNVKSLVDKAGLKDEENKEVQQKLTDALRSGMDAATFQQMEMIMKDPKKSGIDVSAPMYIFNAEAFPYTSVVAKVTNEGDLQALLETLVKEQVCQPLASGDGFQFTQMRNQVFLAYTPSTVMLTGYSGTTQLEKVKQNIPALLKQTGESCFASTTTFKKMQQMGGDMNTFFSWASIPDFYTKQLKQSLPQNIHWEDLQMLGSLSFDKGKISMNCKYFTENPELQAMFDKQRKASYAIENSFMKFFPKSTLMYISAGLNGEEIYNLLAENEDFQKVLSKTNEMKELFGMFQKDVAMGLTNVTMNGTPTFLLHANVKSAAPLQALYEKKDELGLQDILKTGENEYVYKSYTMNVFFGVRGNNLYATNDENLYNSIDKTVDPSIKDTEFASDIKGQQGAVIINTEAILELPIVKTVSQYGGKQAKTALALVDKIAYVKVVGEDENTEAVIQLKDKDVNALKQIVNFIKEFAGI